MKRQLRPRCFLFERAGGQWPRHGPVLRRPCTFKAQSSQSRHNKLQRRDTILESMAMEVKEDELSTGST